MNQYWFKPKRYGYGATPISWEGWAVIAVDVAIMAVSVSMLVREPRSLGALLWIAVIAITTAALVYVCRKKTDGVWKWRWGQD
ncbi:MAG TPA: hypothetical protein VFB45_22700 [Pseudolabrys sp.]|nr:hypothetical protein [Pseudolabrys sp.]